MKNSAIYITDNFIRFGWQEISINSFKKEDIPSSFRNSHLILGIPRTQVIIKNINLPSINDQEIKKMVEYELNNLFPYKPEELIYDHAVMQKGPGDYSQLILAVAPRENILKNISALKNAGITPDEISISTVSLFNQFRGQNRPDANYLLVYLDDGFMEIIYISSQKILFSRGVSFSQSQAKEDVASNLELTIAVLRDKGNTIDSIVLGGSGVNLNDFAKGLEEGFPYKIDIDTTLNVVNGLSLKSSAPVLNINLLPQDLRIRKEKKILRRSLLISGALVLLNISLIANIIFVKIKAKQEYLALLKNEIEMKYSGATVLQKKMHNLQMLRSYINSGRLTLGLLSDIYRLAPQGINLSSLDISTQSNPGTMVLTGQARGQDMVYKFAGLLKGSVFVKKTDVSYITKTKGALSDEIVDFEIRSTL